MNKYKIVRYESTMHFNLETEKTKRKHLDMLGYTFPI